MSVEPLAPPVMRPVAQRVPPRPDTEGRWPLGVWSLNEFIPIALAPFGLVLFANYLVFGFLGWDSDGGAVLVTAVKQLSLLVPIIIWVRHTRGSLAPIGLRRGWRARDVVAGIGAGLGAVLAGTVAIAITAEVVRAITGHQPTVTTPLQDTAGPWLVIDAVMAVCLAPICEEVYFRGFLFQGLRSRMRFVWAALVSGSFFAFVHVEPIRFFGLALMGVILASVFEHRRTLLSSVAAHATINVIAVLALLATR